MKPPASASSQTAPRGRAAPQRTHAVERRRQPQHVQQAQREARQQLARLGARSIGGDRAGEQLVDVAASRRSGSQNASIEFGDQRRDGEALGLDERRPRRAKRSRPRR